MLWEPTVYCTFDRAHLTVHRVSPELTLLCKVVCPEVNHVYTALGPL